MPTVALIDYGSGNLASAAKALVRAANGKFDILTTADPEVVLEAERVVLPGVGAFADCMRGLSSVPGMVPALRDKVLTEQRAYGGFWRDLLSEARAAGEIRPDVDLSVVRMAIMGALNWAADWYKPGRMSPEAVARDITAMMIGGLDAKDLEVKP